MSRVTQTATHATYAALKGGRLLPHINESWHTYE